MRVELLVNPFCLCDRDFRIVSEKCQRLGLSLTVYNLWEIEDADLSTLPDYMSSLIREWRSGERPGSVYSNLFINGNRIPINDWPKSFDDIEARMQLALQEEQ